MQTERPEFLWFHEKSQKSNFIETVWSDGPHLQRIVPHGQQRECLGGLHADGGAQGDVDDVAEANMLIVMMIMMGMPKEEARLMADPGCKSRYEVEVEGSLIRSVSIWDKYILWFYTNTFFNLRQIHLAIFDEYILQSGGRRSTRQPPSTTTPTTWSSTRRLRLRCPSPWT